MRNNPINFIDPSGHVICNDEGVCFVPPPNTGGSSGSDSSGGGGNNGNNDNSNLCKRFGECEDSSPNKGKGKGLNLPNHNNSSQNFWPDYYLGSIYLPVIANFPLFGINFDITVDKYWNVYINVGFAIGIGPSGSGGAGWLLGSGNDKEHVIEKFLQGHSFNVAGGSGLGVGFNNVTHPMFNSITKVLKLKTLP